MFIKRDIEKILERMKKFPVIAIMGPRQSGKTTLAHHAFKNYTYLNFEDPEIREFALQDPKRFLRMHENEHGIILDEFQHVPQILSYIQLEADEKDRPGYFVITGSQNFLMNEAITQSLAGRVAILTLLPLSINELQKNKLLLDTIDQTVFFGGYPRIYAKDILPHDLYSFYISTYIERDIRQIINVDNIRTFQKFMQLCAGRIGQLLNIADIAANCGVDHRVISSWLSHLEASYIIFTLKPHHANFNKRVIKMPKLYFYDSGLACSLLEIHSQKDLMLSPFRGPLVESFVIADFCKQYYNAGMKPPLYFWRDKNGTIEIDCLVDKAGKLIPIEIKSGETIAGSFFDSLSKWNEISGTNPEENYLVYGGNMVQHRSKGTIIGWQKAGTLISKIERT